MRGLVALLLLLSIANAEFLMETVEVTISDIKSDGSAKVHESIKVIIYGDYSMSLYDSSISSNELSVWSTNTGLRDVKFHVNPAKVDIRDFRLRPQPRTGCNPIQGTCHGELILDYFAYPSYSNNSIPVAGTGLFTIDKYKPRTNRYTLNPSSLSFTTTADSDIILEQNVYLTLELPPDSKALDVNPEPAGSNLKLPSHVDRLSWSDIVLVKFSMVFDVEESIEKEISDFFVGILNSISSTLSGPHGFAVLFLICILVGAYLYITVSKRKVED